MGIIIGDVRTELATLDSESVQTVITSPPYWGLRDYGIEGQIGSELSLVDFLDTLVEVFRGIRRVLRNDGTVWLNLGDSYGHGTSAIRPSSLNKASAGSHHHAANEINRNGFQAKQLVGVPWRVALALQADGWYLRSDIIWSKPNPVPECVTDRPTRSHEYIFLLTKQKTYYYDNEAIKEGISPKTLTVSTTPRKGTGVESTGEKLNKWMGEHGGRYHPTRRNKRSVWTVTSKPFRGAHFATFPIDLIEPCVLAGSPPKVCAACLTPYKRITERGPASLEQQIACGGDRNGHYTCKARKDYSKAKAQDPSAMKTRILAGMVEVRTLRWDAQCSCKSAYTVPVVLDPFCGSGTVGVVCKRHGREFIGIDINPEYGCLAIERIENAV